MLSIKDKIVDYAISVIKIDAIGFTKPEIPFVDLENYKKYLKEKNYGDMLWMESRFELRSNPKLLLPSAQSVIVLGFNYFDDSKIKKDYEISLYANQKIDYHKWVYSKIKLLSVFLNQEFQDENRFFVDSAPILEKVLAKQKETFTCECGSEVRCSGKAEHYQSNKHKNNAFANKHTENF